MAFEVTKFFIPRPAEQLDRPPARPPRAFPDGSKFANTLDWALFARQPAPRFSTGLTAADEFLMEQLDRRRAADQALRDGTAGVYGAPPGVRAAPVVGLPARPGLPGAGGAGGGYPGSQIYGETLDNGFPFDTTSSIVTPLAGAAETVVLTFTVPFGVDGSIRGIHNQYTGPGFVEGSGDLIWRIRVAGAYVRNYNDIRTTMGSLVNPRLVEGGVEILSDQLVEYTVEHTALSLLPAAGTRIICSLRGRFWPSV